MTWECTPALPPTLRGQSPQTSLSMFWKFQCPQCGELLDHCRHRDTRDDVSSVSSCGQSSAPSVAVSDQPLTFNTFQPFKYTTHDQLPSVKKKESSLAAALNEAEAMKAPSDPLARLQVSNLSTCGKKRLSAIELPTGETYLPIEQNTQMALMNPSALERDLGLVAREYRGGGTLPRHGLQQVGNKVSLTFPGIKIRSSSPSWMILKTEQRAGESVNNVF